MTRMHIETVGDVCEFATYNETSGDLLIERVQDIEPTLQAVAAEAADTGGRSKSGLMWHIGDLPYTVWSAYGRLRGLPDNWVYLREYRDELVKLVQANPRLSPTNGKV